MNGNPSKSEAPQSFQLNIESETVQKMVAIEIKTETEEICFVDTKSQFVDGIEFKAQKWNRYKMFYDKTSQGEFCCKSCCHLYKSRKGVLFHVKNTVCGIGSEEKARRNDKNDWRHRYKKDDTGTASCNNCGKEYKSLRGIHYHLKTTKCGSGDKASTKSKKDCMPMMFSRGETGVFICKKCKHKYKSLNGLRYHLKTLACELGETPSKQLKTDWTSLYSKVDDIFSCLQCSSIFGNLKPLHRHLKSSSCGDDAPKQKLNEDENANYCRSDEKKNYLRLYSKDGDMFRCNGCNSLYQSLNGMHFHLKTTICGFGNKNPNSFTRKDFRDLYMKLDTGDCICLGCGSCYQSNTGLYHHLRRTECGRSKEGSE